ncbi:zf-TFIIB domain-containing protein [Variovorax sp. PCZ-1]|uniref:TFIIB-type zinc ribbon-containing protein n=1 Tax=Variovorax sp. PCZ-1 TaxID=2835533 RepID=UPI001BCA6CA1|nr:zf-TFIIB domain-containing protein [Variovorax sp. PCZ-1]
MQQLSTCTSCQQPLKEIKLEGHYGQGVTADVCGNCHLVWFDAFESVRLSGLGWVGLLREMIATPRAAQSVPTKMQCVRCKGSLKAVRNLTRFGRTAALECERGHGHFQGFALLLAERGLVRTINSHDLAALKEENTAPSCLNCGAPVEDVPTSLSGQTPVCKHCDTPLMLFDLPRLTQALLVRHGDVLTVEEPRQQLAIACRGCGQPLDATQDTSCENCGHVVAMPRLESVKPLLDKIEPILRNTRARQARPWGEKLKNMKGDASATQLHRWLGHTKDIFSSGNHRYSEAHSAVNYIGAIALMLFLYWLFG